MRHVKSIMGAQADRPRETVYGVKMWPNWTDKTYAYCHYGTYGNYLADILASIDKPFCFIDVGANQGLFSLLAGFNPNCRQIIALEPVPETHQKLAANISANGLDDVATALNAGLSSKSGEFPMTLSKGHSGLATLEDHAAILPGEHQTVTVRLESMRSLASQLDKALPLFVKIDVEGHEETVIRELLASPEADRIIGIFYEHDDRWTNKSEVDAMLDAAGFEHSRIFGRGKHYDVLATPRSI